MFLLWIKSIFAIHKGTIIFFYPDKLKKLLGSILKFFIPLLCGSFLVSVQSFGHAPDRSHFTI